MLELKTKLQQVLLADATLAVMLNVVPETNEKAVYLNHLSQFQDVLYPAISIFIEGGGADDSVLFSEAPTVQLDIWTREEPDKVGLVYGLTGAWQIYRRLKQLVHQAHNRGALSSPGIYSLVWFTEIPGSMAEDWDGAQHLHHIATRFAAQIIPAGAELTYL